MKLFNTLTRKTEQFLPLNPPKVTFYSCGPTVYDYTHIGHLRTFVNNDLLKRTLEYAGFDVHHVMNITDVGHLTGDDDSGVDKLEKGAKKQNKSVWDIVQSFTEQFIQSIKRLNIVPPKELCKATDHITDMIELIQKLEKRGVTYQTDEAIYFDTSKFLNYGNLSHQKIDEKIVQARKEVYSDPNKRNPVDFALWFKCIGRFKKHVMRWKSPWGDGFPGWHIECSAMSMKYLGDTIDIHAGGIDHIPIHHENEIAQSEGATEKPFVKYWFHSAFLLVDNEKMSKSKNNFYTIDDLKNKGYDPISLRYLFLMTHYQKPLNFTWEALTAAQNGLNTLRQWAISLRDSSTRSNLYLEKLEKTVNYQKQISDAIFDNSQFPQALAVLYEMLKSNIPPVDKWDILMDFNHVSGLKLDDFHKVIIPQSVTLIAEKRNQARKRGDFDTADKLRDEISKLGFTVEDVTSGFILKK